VSGTFYQHTSQTKMTAILGAGIFVMTIFMALTSDLLSTTEYTIAAVAVVFCVLGLESVTVTIDSRADHIDIERRTCFAKKQLTIPRESIQSVDRVRLGKKKNAFITTRFTYWSNEKLINSPNLIVQDLFISDEDNGTLLQNIGNWKKLSDNLDNEI